MTAPNRVTVINNSGDFIKAGVLAHFAGVPLVDFPVSSDRVLDFTALAPGATMSGIANVSSALDDFWLFLVSIDGQEQNYLLMPNTLQTAFYKECGTPEQGTTTIEIRPPSSDGRSHPVRIETFKPNGDSDGPCMAALVPLSLFTWQNNQLVLFFVRILKNLLG